MKYLFKAIFILLMVPQAYAQETLSLKNPVDVRRIVATESIAKDAYLWGYPLVRFERTKKLLTSVRGVGHAPINYFYHASRPATPQDRDMTNPLPDMLYSSAVLDLREQPMILQTPRINRPFSLQVMDAYTNTIAIVSTRTHSDRAGKFFITGPRYIGSTPEGFEHVRSSTNFVWMVGHIAAQSPNQVKSSYNLLKRYDLRPYSVFRARGRVAKAPALPATAKSIADPRALAKAGVGFYDELGLALTLNEPANLETAMMERFRSIDVGPGISTSKSASTREVREAYERAIASAEITMDYHIRKNLLSARNGWIYISRKEAPDSNYALRAALAKVYFAEAPAVEALHPVLYSDKTKVRLNGNENYVLHFDKDKMPPASGFWSVVTYNARTKTLVENSLDRYSLGSYSNRLVKNQDGSLDIYISANEPPGRTANWLPAPRGNFYVMMNMYQPSSEAIAGTYVPPSLVKTTASPTQLSLNK